MYKYKYKYVHGEDNTRPLLLYFKHLLKYTNMYKYKYKYVRGEDNKRLLPLSCTLDTSSANISSGPMGSDKRATVFANIRQHDGTWRDRGGETFFFSAATTAPIWDLNFYILFFVLLFLLLCFKCLW